MWNEFVTQNLLPTLTSIFCMVLTAAAGLLVAFLNKKKNEIEANMENETAKKYLDMVYETVASCVLMTNQTYVEALKKDNAFTKEAQTVALTKTLMAVESMLGTECLNYLETITFDVEEYLTNLIEAQVNIAK